MTQINVQAFQNSAIERVIFPPTLTSIPTSFFAFSSSIQSIEFEGNVTELPNGFLSNAVNIQYISIFEAVVLDERILNFDLSYVTYIGSGSFSGVHFVGVFIPYAITLRHTFIFSGHYDLQFVDIPNGTFQFPDRMFSGCRSLQWISHALIPILFEQVLDFTNTQITNIGNYVFQNVNIQKILLPALTQFSEYSFYNINGTLDIELKYTSQLPIDLFAFVVSIPNVKSILYNSLLVLHNNTLDLTYSQFSTLLPSLFIKSRFSNISLPCTLR